MVPASDASTWNIPALLRSVHSLFNETQARREDVTRATSSEQFGLNYCNTRWLENVTVAERVLEMWHHSWPGRGQGCFTMIKIFISPLKFASIRRLYLWNLTHLPLKLNSIIYSILFIVVSFTLIDQSKQLFIRNLSEMVSSHSQVHFDIEQILLASYVDSHVLY